jgi:hypothetical protein
MPAHDGEGVRIAMTAHYHRIMPVAALVCIAAAALSVERLHAQGAPLDSELELVDLEVLRVCADPNNLPRHTS